jgi:hypothetical protein
MRNLVLPVKHDRRAQAQARQVKGSNRPPASRLCDDRSGHDSIISAGLSPLRQRPGRIACRCAVPLPAIHIDRTPASSAPLAASGRIGAPPRRSGTSGKQALALGSGFKHCVIFFASPGNSITYLSRVVAPAAAGTALCSMPSCSPQYMSSLPRGAKRCCRLQPVARATLNR